MAVKMLIGNLAAQGGVSCLVRRDRLSRAGERAWSMEMLGGARKALTGEAFRMGDMFESPECLSKSSPIVTLRREMGIRLTRRSMRDRRSFACRAYCERSLRALSVTISQSVSLCPSLLLKGPSSTYFQAVGCRSMPASDFGSNAYAWPEGR